MPSIGKSLAHDKLAYRHFLVFTGVTDHAKYWEEAGRSEKARTGRE